MPKLFTGPTRNGYPFPNSQTPAPTNGKLFNAVNLTPISLWSTPVKKDLDYPSHTHSSPTSLPFFLPSLLPSKPLLLPLIGAPIRATPESANPLQWRILNPPPELRILPNPNPLTRLPLPPILHYHHRHPILCRSPIGIPPVTLLLLLMMSLSPPPSPPAVTVDRSSSFSPARWLSLLLLFLASSLPLPCLSLRDSRFVALIHRFAFFVSDSQF